uniref:TonB-dependent receptor n=1 Tax=uncultured Ignavibacteria bacterium Rifle_16ft_4_minimus_38087 TaxID=1665104 RepID=A0A0H4T6X1_9BACT|nr:TonB-dependent receptor [uncultured Ignavibacteria bacterium Rifle_16ft_4_minimus_38087]
MLRKLLAAFTALFLLPVLLLAQDGKLRGRVTDKESGEPLIGANVTIDGTSLGASSDLNGDYIILSVPPGTYTVKASYIGYSSYTISNIRVLSNITETQDFALSSTAIQVEAVEVVAERPLIQRNTTNTVRIQTQEDIKNIPIRGVQNIVALNAGIVLQGGNLYVRGGRAGEVAYYVDGANITNPIGNYQNIGLIQEALEEIQVQTGGFTAEFGGANSGLVRTTSRTGGSKINATLDIRTDDFAKPGDKFLGTTSQGYRNVVATLGGPIPGMNGIRVFGAAQNNYLRNDQAMYLTPFKFTGFTDDGLWRATNFGKDLPGMEVINGDTVRGIVEFKENYLYKNWTNNWTFSGNAMFDLNTLANLPLKLRILGQYATGEAPNSGSWPGALANYYRPIDRVTMSYSNTRMLSAKLTHLLSPTTFYEVGLTWQYRYARTWDQKFKHNWIAYADSSAWAAAGLPTDEWLNRYNGPDLYSTIFAFRFTHPYAPNNGYSKSKQVGLGVNVDLVSQVTSNWELKAGGSLDSWTMRSYSVNNVANLLRFLDPDLDGDYDATYASKYEERIRYLDRGGITTYGYTYLGKESDGYNLDGAPAGATLDEPYKPLYASAYVQSKYEYRDLILNVGLRFEHYDPKIKTVDKTLNPITREYDYNQMDYNVALGIIDESQIKQTEGHQLLLPRISFSFPISDRTVFFSQFGKFAQFASLGQFYFSSFGFSRAIAPEDRSPYGGGLGFEARPERTTSFETGIRQLLTDNLSFTLTAFYKDTKDQMQIRRHFNSAGTPIFTTYQNADFGTVKGVELTLDLRRTNRLSARINYTLSDAKGTGSSSTSGGVTVSDELRARAPEFINPMPFNQAHVGSIILDYRFAKGDGGAVLEGMGLNTILSFNSGHNYTKINEPNNLGQSSPWNIGVYPLLDARFRQPSEPVGASTTPWVFNIDLNFNKVFYFNNFNLEFYVNVLNLLDTKKVINLHPATSSPNDDGWLQSPLSLSNREIDQYEAFYRAINLDNRWGLMGSFVGDVYGAPRAIRVGLKFEY